MTTLTSHPASQPAAALATDVGTKPGAVHSDKAERCWPNNTTNAPNHGATSD